MGPNWVLEFKVYLWILDKPKVNQVKNYVFTSLIDSCPAVCLFPICMMGNLNSVIRNDKAAHSMNHTYACLNHVEEPLTSSFCTHSWSGTLT
jgi:hypothetical protein